VNKLWYRIGCLYNVIFIMKFIFKRFTLVAVAILALLLVGCNADTTTLPSNTTTTMNTIDQLAMPEIGEEILVFKTNMGVIKARLFKEGIPETHKNFVFHVEEGNYDGTIFHRVMDGFMIQGGDIDGLDGMGGYSYKGKGTAIGEEFTPELRHHRGALSMAKTQFPNTTGSQFFIVQAEEGTPFLDDVHSVFGQVFEGMEVVDDIAAVEVDGMDKPFDEVVVESVSLEKYE